MLESWPKACWRGGKIEVCFKRLPNLFGKEFALCSLSLVSPRKQDEMAFVRGWSHCSDASVSELPA